MTNEQAKQNVLSTNPNAIFKEDAHGSFDAYDFTCSDEVRAVIYYYDDVFGALYHANGEEVSL